MIELTKTALKSFLRVRQKLSLQGLLPARLQGCLFLPLPDDHVFRALRSGKGFEEKELAFLNLFLGHGCCFWDVGANFGLYTVLGGHRLRNSGTVLAIEPDPRNYLRLRANVLLNRLWHVKTLQAALADCEAHDVDFTSCSQGAYSSLKVAEVPGSLHQIRVRQTTLDSLYASLNRPRVDLLKMDVEGAELLVLQGGANFFGNSPRPVVMCEFSDRRTVAFGYPARDVFLWLAEHDYVLFHIGQGGSITPAQIRESYDYENIVAFPRERRESYPLRV